MFQSVRPNSQIYVFHKTGEPRLETGFVVSQPMPKAKYQIPQTFGQPQELIVDLTVKINNQTVTYSGIPATADIADCFSNGENVVISDSRDAMNAEILSIKQKSLDIISSVDYHNELIKSCDSILADLNPEFAEKQAQKVEIDGLKAQVSEMTKSLNDLMETNRVLVEKLSKKEI